MRPARTEIGVEKPEPRSVQPEVDQVGGDDRGTRTGREQNVPAIGRLKREGTYVTTRRGALTRPLT